MTRLRVLCAMAALVWAAASGCDGGSGAGGAGGSGSGAARGGTGGDWPGGGGGAGTNGAAGGGGANACGPAGPDLGGAGGLGGADAGGAGGAAAGSGPAVPVVPGWTRQFGSTNVDRAYSVNVDRNGNVLVAGSTAGPLPGVTNPPSLNAFVRKYDAAGTMLWSREFGSSEEDSATSVSVDGNGDILVVGYTLGAVPGQLNTVGADAFVRKYDTAGNELWTRQFGSAPGAVVFSDVDDYAYAVTVDGQNNVLVVGDAGSMLPCQSQYDTDDVFVRKYGAAGNELWTRVFGSNGIDHGMAVSTDGAGSVLVAGYIAGTLSGQTSAGENDAFVRKYDAAGNEQWTRQFGSLYDDRGLSVSADASGNVFVAGNVFDLLPGQTVTTLDDAFVRKYDMAGLEQWTRQFGTNAADLAFAVREMNGDVIVAGYTNGALTTQANAGGSDAFVRRYSAVGIAVWTRQIGTTGADAISAVSVDGAGNIVVAGYTNGTLPGQTSAGNYDAFVTAMAP